jgi:hypothetical protein
LSVYAGEDLIDTAPVVQKTWKTLTIEDENWEKVMKWVVANKSMGLTKIVKTLQQKYSIPNLAKAEIKKHI